MQLTTFVCLAASLLAGGEAPVSTVESRPGYNSWPMIQAIGKRLVCTYSRGTQHDVFEGVRGTWAKWSDDDGRTWHGPHLVADDPTVGETPIGKGLDSSGAALFWVRAYAEKTKRHELYRTKDGVTFERIAVPALDPMPVQITDVFRVPGRGLVALWFAGNYLDTDAHKSWGDLVSTDDGRTWTQRTIGSELAKDQWPTEPSVARLPDGRLLCIARSERYQPEKALQWQLESTDGGLTWTKSETNIRDVMASTPSLVYDEKTGLLYNYYYERGKCVLKRRVVRPEAVWGKPLAWPEPEVVSRGSDSPWDSGNACATTVGRRHFIAYYTGKHPDTSVVVAAADAVTGRAFEIEDDFSVVDPRGGAYSIELERNSTLSHGHGWVEDGRYRIPVNGNKHLIAAPALGDFRLEADYELVRFHRFDFTLGYAVYFRYDRATRRGHTLEIFYDRFLKLHVAVDGKDVFVRQDQDPLKLDGLKLVFEAKGPRGHVETLGASVDFDIPAGGPVKGAVGFDLTINEGVKMIFSRLALRSDENPPATKLGSWRFALANKAGFVAPPVYDVTLVRYDSGETRLDCRLSGLLPGKADREGTGGHEWCSLMERVTDPFVKVTGADGSVRKVFFWNGQRKFKDPQMGGKTTWPMSKSVVYSDFPADFTVAAGYGRAMTHPWRFAANGPYEQLQAKDGTVLHEGESVDVGTLALAVRSPMDKKILARFPVDLPERERALDHARKGHYFLASETPRFTFDVVWRAKDYADGEIVLEPRIESVYGESTDIALLPADDEMTVDLGAGLRRRTCSFALARNPGVGVWHLETDVGSVGRTRTERTVFEVLSDDPNGPCPPLASGLPTFVSMPNEIKYLEESAFDPWSELGGVSHYFSIDMRYAKTGDRLHVWDGDHVYGRKYYTWLTRRNCKETDAFDPVNVERLKHIDSVAVYPTFAHNQGRFDLALAQFYIRGQLEILTDYIRVRNLKLKLLTPERLAQCKVEQKGITGAELGELFDTCWDDFKAYARRAIDARIQKYVDGLLAINPKLARGSYGPMPVYTACYKSPYTLEMNSHPLESDPRLKANGSFFLFEDYHYSCDYPLCRPAYFVAAYSLLCPNARRIFPEIYYEGWERCEDGAVYQAHPDKYPKLSYAHQRRIAYQFACGTPFLRDDGTFGYWTDDGFHARSPEKEAMDEFVKAWGNVVRHRPAKPLKSPFVFVDPDAFRRHGDRYEADGSYALVGPGFNDVRSDVINTAEEDVGYAYERCVAEGYATPVVARLKAMDALNAANCEFAILPPLVKGTPAAILDAVRRLHARGVNLLCFEAAEGLEDLFDVSGAQAFARRTTATGRTVFVKTPPTLVRRSTFKARYQRGRDTVSPEMRREMRAAFAYLAPEPAVKAERGTIMAFETADGKIAVVTSDDSPIYGDAATYPATFRFTVSAAGLATRDVSGDARLAPVAAHGDRLTFRTETEKDAANYFLFQNR